jgi:SNF2 family DNA or RNA helicase
MYQQIKILDTALVGGKNFESWVLEYGDIGTKWSDYEPNPKAWKLGKLAELNDKLMSCYSAKRKMDECLDLPLDYEVPTFTLPMGKSHRELYKHFIQSELEKMKEEAARTGRSLTSVVLNQFSWLQSACENPMVLRDTANFSKFPKELQKLINDFDYLKDNAKVPLMDEILAERCGEEGKRGIIWCAHPATVQVLAEHYKDYDPVVVTKETEDKLGEVERFKKDTKHKVLITSVYVLNTSITVTEAKFNLYAERCFNYTIYSQTRGRIHRPGKSEATKTYQLVFDKSTDAVLDANLRMKGKMIDRLLSKDFFSEEEWKNLFNFRSGASFLGEEMRWAS